MAKDEISEFIFEQKTVFITCADEYAIFTHANIARI